METFFQAQKWNTLKCIDKVYNNSNDGITGMLSVFVFIYANDTVMLTENEHANQRNVDLLNEYCICNKPNVNISKTRMMVFARSMTRIRNIRTFKFGNTDLDQVEDYIYLGICFNWNRSFVTVNRCCMTKLQRYVTHTKRQETKSTNRYYA
ncbi:hypothetical protein NP493_310g02027 [Ridgeia piscesae]|uniref:Reverse transcriptase domain-containing protein n=1 Tax=Ridgeia piscesae TaxID=27915 RepID=A0AAD9L735_RIDPI|nr:hypothetical protein NP493_310g02027 [Ridgeia piscesae]